MMNELIQELMLELGSLMPVTEMVDAEGTQAWPTDQNSTAFDAGNLLGTLDGGDFVIILESESIKSEFFVLSRLGPCYIHSDTLLCHPQQ